MAFSIFYFACAAVAASFVAKRVAGCGGAAVRALAFLVFVTVLLIVPVQALAWLKIVGVVDSIRFDHLAALQAVVLAAAYGLRARTPVRPWASDFRSLSRAVRSAPVYILAAAAAVVGDANITKQEIASMGGEDFSYYLEHVPGCYVRFGTARDGVEQFPAHSSKFNIDEEVLAVGAAYYHAVAKLAGQSIRNTL